MMNSIRARFSAVGGHGTTWCFWSFSSRNLMMGSPSWAMKAWSQLSSSQVPTSDLITEKSMIRPTASSSGAEHSTSKT